MFRAKLREVVRRALEDPYLLTLSLGTLVLYAALFARFRPTQGGADGHYAYLFARSLAFDHDIDFRNDYALCGDPWATGRDRGTGLPDNPSYVGPSLFWAPLLALARHVVSLPADAAPGVSAGCSGPWVVVALSSSVVVACLAATFSYLAARRLVARPHAAMATVLFVVASNLPAYVALFPAQAHVYQCFACALLLWTTLRASESESRTALLGVALAVALATFQRLSDGVLALIPLALLAIGKPRRARGLAFAAVAAGLALGALPVLSIYRALYGSPFTLPQGRNYLHLAHSHPLLALFAPHGGLFYTTPIAYLAVIGAYLALRDARRRKLAVAILLAAASSLWISASALDWHGKGTFGARRLVVLLPLCILLSAIALERLAPLALRHARGLGLAALALLFGVPVIGGLFAVERGELAIDRGSPQAIQYGNGVRALFALLDDRVGDVAILPAEWVFSLRYGLPPRSFRAATTDRYYRRSYHTLEWEPRMLDFRDANLRTASRGFAASERGMRLSQSTGGLVFAAGWPYATDLVLVAQAMASTRLSLALGTFTRRCALGTRELSSGENQLEFRIPEGCFDSGLMEVTFGSEVPGAVEIVRLELEDASPHPKSY
ncbi:MAG: hypothetical protein U0263_35945 [Polyangiaceae bacterium]